MKLLLLLPFISLLFSLGCVAVPPQPVGENPLVQIATLGSDNLFSANQDGSTVAVVKGGLSFVDLSSRSHQKLSSEVPIALSWNHDGSILASTFKVAAYETRLVLYSQSGVTLNEFSLPVALSQITWSARGDLLVTGFLLKTFTFGGNLRQLLYQIDSGKVQEIVLSDSTLRPSIVRQLEPVLKSFLPVVFSPYGDELVFLNLHDPPEFPPYLELTYKNWQVADAVPLQRLSAQPFELAWTSSVDSVELRSGPMVDLVRLWPEATRSVDLLPTQSSRFEAGRLYIGEDMLADWGETAQFQALADGTFLLGLKGTLYLGDGLPSVPHNTYNEKQWNLRRWRYEGLITPDEYLNLLQEEKQ